MYYEGKEERFGAVSGCERLNVAKRWTILCARKKLGLKEMRPVAWLSRGKGGAKYILSAQNSFARGSHEQFERK